MLEDFRLKVFTAVAEQKSFTRAAQQLRVSQSAVSQHISELERTLGVRLFERLYGETVLTPAGRVFLSYAGRIIEDYQRAGLLFSPQDPVVIKVASSEEVYDYLMNELLRDFVAVHPHVTFVKSFEQDADIKVSLRPDSKEKGTFALSVSPSAYFTSTKLWKVLSYLFASLL